MVNDARPVVRIIYIVIAVVIGLAIAQIVTGRKNAPPSESLIEQVQQSPP